MTHRHPRWLVDDAVRELQTRSIAAVASELALPLSTIAYWHRKYVVLEEPYSSRRAPCPRCDRVPLKTQEYVTLLGWYLGDGHIKRGNRTSVLTIYNDAKYRGLSQEIAACITAVKSGSSPWQRTRRACCEISSSWAHWPCLLPQHGPGRKHERDIRLLTWQRDLVQLHACCLLRGLFHSDGCRITNWVTRYYRGNVKRYEYPRYFFTNNSPDIMAICQEALDQVGVEWKQPRWNMLSVNKREAVARLDEHVGLKY